MDDINIIKKTKTEEAKEIIKNSEELLKTAEGEIQEFQGKINNHIEDLKSNKSMFINKVFNPSKELISKVTLNETDKKEIIQEEYKNLSFKLINTKTNKKLKIKKITKGFFSQLIIFLIGISIVITAWICIASEKLNLILRPVTIPTDGQQNDILIWIGKTTTAGFGSYTSGIIVISITAFIFSIFLLYLYSKYKENKNLRVAKNTFIKSQKYYSLNKDSKKQIGDIDVILKESISLIKNYYILLNEKNGSLQRIIHTELNNDSFHKKSEIIMSDTKILINSIENWMLTPIINTSDNELNKDFKITLNSAQKIYNDMISNIYL